MGSPGNGGFLAPLLRSRAEGAAIEAGKAEAGKRRLAKGVWNVFWIYWDTAWSLIISGIMFATIVAHPDAEIVEMHAAKPRM